VDLPAGAPTVLFTDIEGSTRLIAELGENGYVEALAEHRRLLRAAFVAHGGVEVDTQGDAFLYAFADAGDALAAAAEGQVALASGPVAVRMGLHTGALQLTGEGYAGRELHRAARIAASGHGGQVVVSAATRELVDGQLRELGEHRLKDFDEPVALFQLGSEQFPPLKTISNTNLPRPASSFVGRTRERVELLGLLRNGSRLVTLSGPGGSGKTRLAIDVASELVPAFKAGVFWVPLAVLRDPELVLPTVAQTLGARNGLADHIGERELLLLLDNFEQVVEAAPELSRLVEACPNLRLLITSRELLRIRGEVDYPVPPLSQPEAVALFCERARLDADTTIPELCRRLDELPLAVELAAARTGLLTPAQILDRLGKRLDLLKGGRDADPRQQTLRATIEWSYDLLNQDEKDLFAHLAVFAGGCILDAAEGVCGASTDVLQSLVDKSLLRHTGNRFWMLETIRELAAERLESVPESGTVFERHARWYLDLAEASQEQMRGAESAEWLARLGAELENFRGAIAWASEHDPRVEVELVAACRYLFQTRGHIREEGAYVEHALETARSAKLDQAALLYAAVHNAMVVEDLETAKTWAEQLLELARTREDPWLLARGLTTLGMVLYEEPERARPLLLEALAPARESGNDIALLLAAHTLGDIALQVGDIHTARQHYKEELDLARAIPNPRSEGIALTYLGKVALLEGDTRAAVAHLKGGLAVVRLLDQIGVMYSLLFLAVVAAREEDSVRAARLLGAADRLREISVPTEVWDEEAEIMITVGDNPAFNDAWSEGRAMTSDDAITYALSE
jgi:predicted ATPase